MPVSAPGEGGLLFGGVCSWGVSALGGCLLLGDVCSWGVSAPRGVSASRGASAPRGVSAPRGGVCSRGVSALGGISAHTEADTPLLKESQTPVKTLPWPNFVAAGKDAIENNGKQGQCAHTLGMSVWSTLSTVTL